jgi:hypothetical protein
MRILSLARAPAVCLFAIGCADILGVQSIAASETSGTSSKDAAVMPDGSPIMKATCAIDSECAPPPTEPAGCATARCVQGTCTFAANDADHDGARVLCVSKDPTRPVEQGARIDCDDADPGVLTGSDVDCTDGSFTLPGLGICRAGKKHCNDNGTFGVCVGAIGKKTEACDNNLDDDCDGTVNNGCACSPGDTRSCGPAQAGTGVCKNGTQSCNTGAWGNCVGAVNPVVRNCGGAADNDCNGTADNQESACACDGTTAVGGTRACSTGQFGVCGAGTQTCGSAGSIAAWGGCVANTTPQPRSCASANDNDCNGIADNVETACKCDGTYSVGAKITCLQSPVFLQKTCMASGTMAIWGNCPS